MVAGRSDAEPQEGSARSGERSRRELLRGGGVMGAAALLAGCTSKVAQPSNIDFSSHTPDAGRDLDILNGLLALEYRSIATYTQCIPLLPQPPKPPPGAKPAPEPPKPAVAPTTPPPPLKLLVPLAYAAAQQFLTHELHHVTELSDLIQQAEGKPVKPEAFYDLGHPRTKQDVLTLLHGTEEMLLQHYLKAASTLTVPALRGAAAAIMANHAQHTSVLRMELGLAPIPVAFVARPE